MGSASNKYFTLCSSPNAWVIIHYFGDIDNFTASKIVESGRSKPKLQIKAVKKSFSCLYMKNINQKNTPHWSGEQCGNWKSVISTFGNSTFRPIIEKWNAMTVDYFLYYKSSKCSRFNQIFTPTYKSGRRFLLSIDQTNQVWISHTFSLKQIWKYWDFDFTLLVIKQIWAFCHLKIKLNL